MARNVTLAKLRGLARLYADQRPGGAQAFIPDVAASADSAGVNDLINLALTELYDLLVGARGHEYYIKTALVTLVSGTAAYSLPTDLYELFTVTLEWTSIDFENIYEIDTVESRADYTNFNVWTQYSPKAYRLRAQTIELFPTPTTAPTCRLQYVPSFTDLVADADTFDGVNGWEKLVALRVAIEMRAVEESPSGDLVGLYEREKERIQSLADERAALATKTVRDVNPEGCS